MGSRCRFIDHALSQPFEPAGLRLQRGDAHALLGGVPIDHLHAEEDAAARVVDRRIVVGRPRATSRGASVEAHDGRAEPLLGLSWIWQIDGPLELRAVGALKRELSGGVPHAVAVRLLHCPVGEWALDAAALVVEKVRVDKLQLWRASVNEGGALVPGELRAVGVVKCHRQARGKSTPPTIVQGARPRAHVVPPDHVVVGVPDEQRRGQFAPAPLNIAACAPGLDAVAVVGTKLLRQRRHERQAVRASAQIARHSTDDATIRAYQRRETIHVLAEVAPEELVILHRVCLVFEIHDPNLGADEIALIVPLICGVCLDDIDTILDALCWHTHVCGARVQKQREALVVGIEGIRIYI
mmetsp:Transcript_67340/g.206240  ORF Transcript_67340/g.206240 Transcript_67340/m.206240 type:complete len:354 (-) Transcript_67340:200-1261(-)